jgi:hypothetical protein
VIVLCSSSHCSRNYRPESGPPRVVNCQCLIGAKYILVSILIGQNIKFSLLVKAWPQHIINSVSSLQVTAPFVVASDIMKQLHPYNSENWDSDASPVAAERMHETAIEMFNNATEELL